MIYKNNIKYIFFSIIFLIFVSGCTNGGGGAIGSVYTGDDYTQDLADAWTEFNNGDFSEAAIDFHEVGRKTSHYIQQDEANLGMGWCYLKDGDLDKAMEYFNKVNTGSQELYIGKISYYIAGNSQENYNQAYLCLKTANLDDITDEIKSSYPVEVSRVTAYALAGIVYYLNGKDYQARQHLNKARESDEYNFDNNVERIYQAIIEELGI